MITNLIYNVESDDNGNYLVSLDNNCKTKLPENTGDELSSFAVSVKNSVYYFQNNTIDVNHIVGELICKKLQNLLDSVWDLSKLGIPSVRFVGNLRKVSDVYKNRTLLIYIKGINLSPLQANEVWIKYISEATQSKFTFLGTSQEIGFSIATTEIDCVNDWLSQYQINKEAGAAKSICYDLELRMKQWYRDDGYRKKLLDQAKSTIDNFILETNLNMFIPGYLVLPAHHVLRYQKAVNLLNEKFNPEFIMSLPMLVSDCSLWTILFPISERVTKNTLRNRNAKFN